jgi:monovalent cation:H+ antiporter-2, CPA2 family
MDGQLTNFFSTLVASLVAALAAGSIAQFLRAPPVSGYIVAGIALGRWGAEVGANQHVASEFANIGVTLLLFGVGLRFAIPDILAVTKLAVPAALVQLTVGTALGAFAVHEIAGTSFEASVFIGFGASVSSTAIALRVLEQHHVLAGAPGRIAVAWLLVQDWAVFTVLLILPALSIDVKATGVMSLLTTALIKGCLLVLGLLLLRRLVPLLMSFVARAGSRELFTLAIVASALGIAYAFSVLFGMSIALGAFLAGLVVGETDLVHSVEGEVVPIEQVFTALFFVATGMLFDPLVVLESWPGISAAVFSTVLGIGLTTTVLLLFVGVPAAIAGIIGGAFAQTGEFTLIMASFAAGQGEVDKATRDMAVAGTLIAIVINPLVVRALAIVSGWLARLAFLERWQARGTVGLNQIQEREGHAVLIGYGRVGSIVGSCLRQHDCNCVIVELNRKLVERLLVDGYAAVFGDATRENVLRAAGVAQAQLVMIAVPDPIQTRRVIKLCARLNPRARILVRTHSDQEARFLTDIAHAELVLMGEREVAIGMAAHALQVLGISRHDAETTTRSWRL